MKIKQFFGIAFVALMWSGVGFGMQTASAPSSAAQTSEQECVFCLEAEGELSKPVDCQHMMHQQPCMEAWRAMGQNSCPVCRRDVFFVGEDRAQVTQRVAQQKVAVAQRTQAEQIEADRAFAEELDPEARNRFEVTQQRLVELRARLAEGLQREEELRQEFAQARQKEAEQSLQAAEAQQRALEVRSRIAEQQEARDRAHAEVADAQEKRKHEEQELILQQALKDGRLPANFPQWFQKFNLTGHAINNLPANFFSNVAGAKEILLGYTGLKTVDVDAFNGLENLEFISFERNNLTHIAPGALTREKLPQLQELLMAGNNFAPAERKRIKEEVGPWVNVRWRSRGEKRPQNVSLQQLIDAGDLPPLRIEKLEEDDKPLNLVALNLVNLSLISLDGLQDVPGIQEVESLDLSENQLTSIPVETLAQLKKLKDLILRGNKLSAEEQERIRQEVGPDVKVYF